MPAEALGPCEVPTPEEEDWRQVAAEGVSFCVPADWRPMGSKGWRGGGGSLTWGSVEPRRPAQGRLLTVRASDIPAPTQERRFSELIGGVSVELWLTGSEGEFLTGATWENPRPLYMNGEAISLRDSEVQLEIYRTVRIIGD